MATKISKQLLFAKPTMKLSDAQEEFLQKVVIPNFKLAIKVAEGDPTRYGVRSIPTSSPEEADKILENSIKNNYIRWMQAGSPGKFVDFMQQRWAPIGAENDPRNLNMNWAPNVRGALQGQLGPEKYGNWERMNLVRSMLAGGGRAV